jgi:hypothetical protein
MDTLFHGLTVPTPCPHCGYAIEQPVGEPQRCTHCPRCTLALNIEVATDRTGDPATFVERSKKLYRPN